MYFEAGVRFANGLKHLAISQIPPKILRLVNFLGFSGKESIAFEEINKVAFEMPGMIGRIGRMFLLGYWLFGQPHAGLGPRELPKATQVLGKELEDFPNVYNFQNNFDP